MSKRRLNVQDNVPDRCLKRMHDNNDDSEHDPEYDCNQSMTEDNSDSREELSWHFLEEHRPEVGRWL